MKIYFTGASSFTGFWFVEALAKRGHQIITPLRGKLEEYKGLRKERIDLLAKSASIIDDCPFGSSKSLLHLENEGPFDLFCHHAAEVADYKSPHFDFAQALANNTKNIGQIFSILAKQKCQRVLITGSVFEQNEGLSSDNSPAVSPYGLSKGLTSDVFKYFSHLFKFRLGKFVIPNPYGPYEEGRFTTYLANCWLQNKIAEVAFPDYVRDNIPVTLLAKCYAQFAEELPFNAGFSRINPSFFPAPQSCFVQQFAQKMEHRWQIPCRYTFFKQTEFSEPKIRINSDYIDPQKLDWVESQAWDRLAEFYLYRHTSKN